MFRNLKLHSSVECFKRFRITYFVDLHEITVYCSVRRHILEYCKPQSPSSTPPVVINSRLVKIPTFYHVYIIYRPCKSTTWQMLYYNKCMDVHGEDFAKHDLGLFMFCFLNCYIFNHVT